jgi:hypothetical protein
MADGAKSSLPYPGDDLKGALGLLAQFHEALVERRGSAALTRLMTEAEPLVRRMAELSAAVDRAGDALRAAAPEFSVDVQFDGFRWRRLRKKRRPVVTLVGQRVDKPSESLHCVFYDEQARELIAGLGAPRTERDLEGPVRLRVTGHIERIRSADSMGRTILFEDMVVTNFEILEFEHLPDLPDYDKAGL